MAKSPNRSARLRRIGSASICLIALLSASSDSAAQAGRSILKYDEHGRAVGAIVEHGNGSEATPGGTATTGAAGAQDPAQQVPDYEPGEILALDPPLRILPRLQSMGYSVVERLDLAELEFDVWRIETPQTMTTPDALEQFRLTFPLVESDFNSFYILAASPSGKSDGHLPYDRETVGWGEVGPNCGSGLRLGMIDSPVDIDHSSFKGRQVAHKSFVRADRSAAASEHGTAIASMLVGTPSNSNAGGLIPGATLYAASIFEDRSGKVIGNLVAMLRAVDWLARQEVQVLNLSIAGSKNRLLVRAIDRALDRDIMLVAAAGNNGPDAKPAWPAAHPGVIAVTAVDKDLSHYRFANQGRYIDFSAPGVRIVTATPRGYKEQSGTSFAAPYITSMVALHLAAGYRSDPDVLRESLKRYSVDLGTKGKDHVFGWGLARLRPDC